MKVQLPSFLQTDFWEDFETKKVLTPKAAFSSPLGP